MSSSSLHGAAGTGRHTASLSKRKPTTATCLTSPTRNFSFIKGTKNTTLSCFLRNCPSPPPPPNRLTILQEVRSESHLSNSVPCVNYRQRRSYSDEQRWWCRHVPDSPAPHLTHTAWWKRGNQIPEGHRLVTWGCEDFMARKYWILFRPATPPTEQKRCQDVNTYYFASNFTHLCSLHSVNFFMERKTNKSASLIFQCEGYSYILEAVSETKLVSRSPEIPVSSLQKHFF